jgi:hypothetical protein
MSHLCYWGVLVCFALAPFPLPDEPRARRRAWLLLALAVGLDLAGMALP